MGQTELLRWIKNNGMTVRDFSRLIGKPLKTVEDWAYGKSLPQKDSRSIIYSITQLETYKPVQHRGDSEAQESSTTKLDEVVNSLGTLLEELEKKLTLLAIGPIHAREGFRMKINPQKAAMVANFLRAMLDEERLENWKLTTRVSRVITHKR